MKRRGRLARLRRWFRRVLRGGLDPDAAAFAARFLAQAHRAPAAASVEAVIAWTLVGLGRP